MFGIFNLRRIVHDENSCDQKAIEYEVGLLMMCLSKLIHFRVEFHKIELRQAELRNSLSVVQLITLFLWGVAIFSLSFLALISVDGFKSWLMHVTLLRLRGIARNGRLWIISYDNHHGNGVNNKPNPSQMERNKNKPNESDLRG